MLLTIERAYELKNDQKSVYILYIAKNLILMQQAILGVICTMVTQIQIKSSEHQASSILI